MEVRRAVTMPARWHLCSLERHGGFPLLEVDVVETCGGHYGPGRRISVPGARRTSWPGAIGIYLTVWACVRRTVSL
jgi:hypothetical protein